MTTLVVGATGATGRLLAEQLLERGQAVKGIVRAPDKLPESLSTHERLTVIRASLLDPSDAEWARLAAVALLRLCPPPHAGGSRPLRRPRLICKPLQDNSLKRHAGLGRASLPETLDGLGPSRRSRGGGSGD